jgi:hypothetical protein
MYVSFAPAAPAACTTNTLCAYACVESTYITICYTFNEAYALSSLQQIMKRINNKYTRVATLATLAT